MGSAFSIERYHQSAYDLAMRAIRDHAHAVNVVATAFHEAWASLQTGAPAPDFSAWLGALTLDALQRAGGPPPGADARQIDSFVPVTAANPTGNVVDLEDRELANVVWQSAAALDLEEYGLLHLHIRNGLTAAQLAAVLGERYGNVLTTLPRLRASLEESVTEVILARRGRLDCPGLAAVVPDDVADSLPLETRIQIRRHLHRCLICQERARSYPSAVEIFAKLPVVPLAESERAALWARVARSAGVPTALPARPAVIQQSNRDSWDERIAWLKRDRTLLMACIVVPAVIVGLFIVAANIIGAVHDPRDVHSTSHRVGMVSAQNVVTISWTAQPDARAFAVAWTQGRQDEPDAHPDLPGTATSATSPALADGTWYFHLRTQGRDGRWTDTVHLGPFPIHLQPAGDTATETPTPSETAMPTATNAPNVLPTWTPTATVIQPTNTPPANTPRPATPTNTAVPTATSTLGTNTPTATITTTTTATGVSTSTPSATSFTATPTPTTVPTTTPIPPTATATVPVAPSVTATATRTAAATSTPTPRAAATPTSAATSTPKPSQQTTVPPSPTATIHSAG